MSRMRSSTAAQSPVRGRDSRSAVLLDRLEASSASPVVGCAATVALGKEPS